MRKGWLAVVVGSALLAAGAVAQPPAEAESSDIPSSMEAAMDAARVERVALSMPGASPSSSASATSSGPAASAPVPGTLDAAAARAAIEKANDEWLAAFKNGDRAALSRIYAPDASLFPPANASLEGRERIVEYFGAQRSAGMGEASLKTLDVVTVGDVAYEVGTYRFRFDGGEGDAAGDTGRYFTIWKSQGDGSWRYQVGIWSSNRDVAVAAR